MLVSYLVFAQLLGLGSTRDSWALLPGCCQKVLCVTVQEGRGVLGGLWKVYSLAVMAKHRA